MSTWNKLNKLMELGTLVSIHLLIRLMRIFVLLIAFHCKIATMLRCAYNEISTSTLHKRIEEIEEVEEDNKKTHTTIFYNL